MALLCFWKIPVSENFLHRRGISRFSVRKFPSHCGEFSLDEFVSLKSKMYALKDGDDSKNKLKGISKSQLKNIKFEEYKNCLDGKKDQEECENHILRSVNHEMYLQEMKKATLSSFDEKRCFIIETESKPWN